MRASPVSPYVVEHADETGSMRFSVAYDTATGVVSRVDITRNGNYRYGSIRLRKPDGRETSASISTTVTIGRAALTAAGINVLDDITAYSTA